MAKQPHEPGSLQRAQLMEQALTDVVNVAQMYATFFHQLVKEGLTPEQALYLTGTYVIAITGKPPQQDTSGS